MEIHTQKPQKAKKMKFTTSQQSWSCRKDMLEVIFYGCWLVPHEQCQARNQQGERVPSVMSLESILTFTDVLYIAYLWRLEFWWSFSKVTEASEFLTIHQVLHSLLPQLFASPFFSATPAACFFLHIAALSCTLPTTLSPRLNDTDLAIYSQISAAWIQLLRCLGLAWRNRDITTHYWGWMRVAICMQFSVDCWDLVILWGYHWIQGKKNQWQIKFIVNMCILFVCLCGQHVFSAIPRYRSFWNLLMPVTFIIVVPAPIV